MRKQTNTLSPSPKGFQSPKFSDSDFREVRGLGLGRPKSSALCYYLYFLNFKSTGKVECSGKFEDFEIPFRIKEY
jgi:hypothetical protein